MSSFDRRALRDAFGAFTTGVTVVTARDSAGTPIGFTANSFASVSLDPPMLLICLAKTSRNLGNMMEAAGFAVNILSETQEEVSNAFARPIESRFAAVDWRDGPTGFPVFPEAAAWFECETEQRVDAGDHVILIGRVVAFENSDRNGLGYARGSYFSPALAARAVDATADGEALIGAVVERDGKVLLFRQSDGRLALPQWPVAGGEPVRLLGERLQAATGLAASVGFLFSVFEHRGRGHQQVIYRVALAEGAPASGEFFPLDALPVEDLADPQARDILRRFAAESAIGDFGVFVGNETAGRVHSLAHRT